METTLEIILFIVPLVAGAFAIFMAFRLMKKYRLSYLNSYFFYLVFLYIFGSYSLIGSGVLEYLLARIDPGSKVAQTAGLFVILPGIPFLVLSKYMLFRSLGELTRQKINQGSSFAFFILALAGFVLYGFFLLRITRFGSGEYTFILKFQRWAFAGYVLVFYFFLFFMSLLFSAKQPVHERKFTRNFHSWYLIYAILTSVLLVLSGRFIELSFVFIFIFLSWHLLPILFLNIHLGTYQAEDSPLHQKFGQQLSLFCDEFNITKREREVILLISKGFSNQEISDALFISLQTVKDHVHRIFLKTGVKNRIQLTNLIRSASI